MSKIYKYELKTTDRIKIKMPRGAKILSLQGQLGIPCIWALIGDGPRTEIRTFEIYGTGDLIEDNVSAKRNFIGTYQLAAGELVFHVFEYINLRAG